MSRDRSTEILEKARTNAGTGLRVSDYATDYIYQGKSFSLSKRFTVEAATNLIIMFDMTLVPANLTVSLYTPTYDASTGPILVDYYTGGDYAINSASILSFNNRAYYGYSSKIVMSYGPLSAYSGTTKGSKFTEDLINSGHKTGGAVAETLEFVPVQRQKILIEYDNTNGTDATMIAKVVWFEV